MMGKGVKIDTRLESIAIGIKSTVVALDKRVVELEQSILRTRAERIVLEDTVRQHCKWFYRSWR